MVDRVVKVRLTGACGGCPMSDDSEDRVEKTLAASSGSKSVETA
jgi:Fe-S cluster biogenesis protein NfuA